MQTVQASGEQSSSDLSGCISQVSDCCSVVCGRPVGQTAERRNS